MARDNRLAKSSWTMVTRSVSCEASVANRITIQLIGQKSDRKDVRLNDFIEQLKHVKRALLENELAISGADKPSLDYKIVGLRHSSPSTVVLEPVPIDGPVPPELKREVVGNFTGELRMIKREGRLLREPELMRLQAYQDIGAKDKSRIAAVKIGSGRTVVTIDQAFKTKLDAIVGPDEFAEGSISGMLEAVNFHNTNRFMLYPTIGPKRIAGVFRPHLRPQVKTAIGSFVTIVGTLSYKAWSPYPHAVTAEKIDEHESAEQLPSLSSMRGAFAGMMGDLTSVEFVEHIRHEDWQ